MRNNRVWVLVFSLEVKEVTQCYASCFGPQPGIEPGIFSLPWKRVAILPLRLAIYYCEVPVGIEPTLTDYETVVLPLQLRNRGLVSDSNR